MSAMTAAIIPENFSTVEISDSELRSRVAVLKRFKEMLKAQRDRFHSYLEALDKQQEVIQKGNTDELLHYVELEEKIVKDIFSIQKVIDPLEEMYQATKTVSQAPAAKGAAARNGTKASLQQGDEELFDLKQALEGLKSEAVLRAKQNRELLAERMNELRSEIKNMKAGAYAVRRSGFAAAAPSHVDIRG